MRTEIAADRSSARTLALWVLTLVAAIAALALAGRGALATPPLLDAAGWKAWAAQRDAVVLVFAGLRLLTLALAWYLLGVTLVGIAGRFARWRGLVAIADTLTVPSVRRLLQSSLGVGLATAAISAGSGAPGTVTAEPAPPAAVLTADAQDGDEVAVMVPVGDAAEVMLPFEPQPKHARDTWTVRQGDHLWSIAESVLEQRWERPPTDAEIAPYWEKLIAHNREQLVDPDNPDLIVPDQVLDLPRAPRPPQS